jgi:1,4-alpha-glucan branching enzyme
MKRFVLCLCVAALIGAGCGGDDKPTGPFGEPELSAWLTMTGSTGWGATAGDTLVSTLRVTNNGQGTADSVTAALPGLPNLDLVDWEGAVVVVEGGTGDVKVSPFPLAAGATRTLTLKYTIPAFYPNGWTATAQATVTYEGDEDGDGAYETVTVLSDDPVSSLLDDPTTVAIKNDGTDFTLTAPGVDRVYLAGSFNSWRDSDSDYLMFENEDGGEFALTMPLSGRHEYKFIVHGATGGKEWLGDPRATRVVWDGYAELNSVTGVDMPDPVDPLPGGIDPERLVIYELFVSDFSSAGRFRDVISGLDGAQQNLADLGVNAVELLPVNAIPGNFNWGYNPWFYFAVDDTYGSPEDFAELVEKAHGLGMAVILDMVFNHVGNGSTLDKLDYLGTQGTWINHDQPDVFGMNQLNWFSEDMREFFLDAALFWIEQYGIDGFRMDLVDYRDLDGYRWWRDQIKARHPNFFLIGEDFSYPPTNSVVSAGFDTQWGGQHTDPWGGPANNFQNLVMAILKEGPYDGRAWGGVGSFDTADNPMWGLANVLSPTSGYPSWTNGVKYIVSHDERRVVDEVNRSESAGARAVGGIKKAKLGAATLFTAAGIPMLYMGDEIGEDDYTPQNPAPNKVDWFVADAGVRATYRNLITLRLAHPDLASGGIEFRCPLWNNDQGPCQQDKTINYWRYTGLNPLSAGVVVAANYDHSDHAFTVQFPVSGTWHLFDPETGGTSEVTVSGGQLATVLEASRAYVYLKDLTYVP